MEWQGFLQGQIQSTLLGLLLNCLVLVHAKTRWCFVSCLSHRVSTSALLVLSVPGMTTGPQTKEWIVFELLNSAQEKFGRTLVGMAHTGIDNCVPVIENTPLCFFICWHLCSHSLWAFGVLWASQQGGYWDHGSWSPAHLWKHLPFVIFSC